MKNFEISVLTANSRYLQTGALNRLQFNYGMTQYFVPLMARDSFLVMDNASIHNERDLRNILAPKNITLVKLPPYSYDFNPIELVL